MYISRDGHTLGGNSCLFTTRLVNADTVFSKSLYFPECSSSLIPLSYPFSLYQVGVAAPLRKLRRNAHTLMKQETLQKTRHPRWQITIPSMTIRRQQKKKTHGKVEEIVLLTYYTMFFCGCSF